MEIAQFGHRPGAQFVGMADQTFLMQHFNSSDRCCARHRVSSKSAQVFARKKTVGQRLRGNEGSQRETIRDSFGQRHDIRLYLLLIFHAKKPASPAKTGLNLVYDEKNAVSIEDLFHPCKIA